MNHQTVIPNHQQRRADYAYRRKCVVVERGINGRIFGTKGAKTGSNRCRPLRKYGKQPEGKNTFAAMLMSGWLPKSMRPAIVESERQRRSKEESVKLLRAAEEKRIRKARLRGGAV